MLRLSFAFAFTLRIPRYYLATVGKSGLESNPTKASVDTFCLLMLLLGLGHLRIRRAARRKDDANGACPPIGISAGSRACIHRTSEASIIDSFEAACLDQVGFRTLANAILFALLSLDVLHH